MKPNPAITALAKKTARIVKRHGLARAPKTPPARSPGAGMLERALEAVDANGCHPIALSVYQPWAEFILNGNKKVENRSWRKPKVTGWVYLHASKTLDITIYQEAVSFIRRALPEPYHHLIPRPSECTRGGIVGAMYIEKWISAEDPEADDPWFVGPHAALITQVRRLPFQEMTGLQGFFSCQLPEL